ncbi:MAG TPA: T9SS type A sorting domain-containing protein [Phnomibacter sp.]|nr:T9SS type A sorting domain-containing protein [Phnomibacter sp.]
MPKFLTACFASVIALASLSTDAIGQLPKDPNLLAAGCDTINYPIPGTWGRGSYAPSLPNSGYYTGTSSFGDKEKAHFFNLSATSNNYITRCFIHFGKAASSVPANLNKAINIKVYDGTSGAPGALLGSTSTTLGNIKIDVALNDKTDIGFPSAIALPASKKFFVSVDFSSLLWNTDSLLVYSSLSGRTPNYCWEKWNDNTWHQITEESGLNLSLYINPFVSPTTLCEVVQPVKLAGFTGTLTPKGHLLKWTTASEQMNKGFYIEYSPNGQAFTTVGFVPSAAVGGNSNLPLQYSFLYQPISNSSESIYRLKQQDLNGTNTYSQLVFLRNNEATASATIGRLFPNPASNVLTIDWVKNVENGSLLRLVDAAGRTIKQQTIAITAKQTTLSTAGLSGGIYVLQVVNAKQQIIDTQKFWID